MDPTEVMSAAELATIPEPVPGGGAPAPAASPDRGGVPMPAASGDSVGASGKTGSPEPTPAADQSSNGPVGGSGGLSGGYLWRVQIFASPELALADGVAKEARRRLGVDYVIQYEENLYKVRLGAFATEAGAQALREKAIQEGFSGAFRVRAAAEATDGRN